MGMFFLNKDHSLPLFGFYIFLYFGLYLRLQLINFMVKEEGKVCAILLHIIRKKPDSQNRLSAILN